MQAKKYFYVFLLLIAGKNISAQKNSSQLMDVYKDTLHFYFKISGGYAMPLAPTNLTSFVPNGSYSDSNPIGFYDIITTYNPGNTDFSYKNIDLSLGKGMNIYGSLGYIFNKHISLEIGGGYVWGSTYTAREITIDHSGPFSKMENGTHYRQLSSRSWIMDASLVIRAKERKNWTPYLKLGALFALPTIYYHEYIQGTPACMPPYNMLDWKYYGGFSIGGMASGGVTYRINKKLEIFGEARIIAFSYAPLKGVMTNYSVRGSNIISSMSDSVTHVSFHDGVSWNSSTSPSNYQMPTNPELKLHFPFSSWGVNFGIKFNFSHVYNRKRGKMPVEKNNDR